MGVVSRKFIWWTFSQSLVCRGLCALSDSIVLLVIFPKSSSSFHHCRRVGVRYTSYLSPYSILSWVVVIKFFICYPSSPSLHTSCFINFSIWIFLDKGSFSVFSKSWGSCGSWFGVPRQLYIFYWCQRYLS